MYAISKVYYTPPEKSVDGKAHRRKLWYCEPIDFGFGLCEVWGKKKGRKMFGKKSDAIRIAKKNDASVETL